MTTESTRDEHDDSQGQTDHEWPTKRATPARAGARGTGPSEAAQPAWSYEGEYAVGTSPAIDGTRAYVDDGTDIIAVDLETGDRLWSFETDEGAGGSPVVADGTVYVGSMDRVLYAIDAETGLSEWTFEPSGSGFTHIVSTPTVVDGMVYVGCNDNNVYAIDADTGEEWWSFATDDKVTSSPAVADGTVYATSEDGTTYAIDAESGVRTWTHENHGHISIESSAAVADGTVFVAGSGQQLAALDAETGQEEWSFDCSTGRRTPVVGDGLVYLAEQGTLHAVDIDTGESVWQVGFDIDLALSPVYADGMVYQPHDDTVVAINATSGERQWAFETGGTIRSLPSIAYGALFLSSEDRHLYALTEGGEPVDIPEAAMASDDEDDDIEEATAEPGWATERGDLARTGTASGAGPTEAPESRWEYETSDGAQGIAADDDTVYLASEDNELAAVDPATGESEWTFEADRGIPCAPAVTGGTVYVGSRDEHLYAVDADTGEQLWSLEATGSFATFGSTPTVADGVVYAPCEDGNLYIADADTGELLWSVERRSDFECGTAVAYGMVYAGAGNTLYAFDIDAEEKRWEFSSGGIGSIKSAPAIVDGTVYTGGTEMEMHALDAHNGVEQWTVELDGNVECSTPVVDGTVYVGTNDASLYALDAETGETEWEVPTDGSVRAAPAVADGIVYVTAGTQIQAHDADNGRKLFSVEQYGDLDLSPVVADGTLYTGGRGFNAYGVLDADDADDSETDEATPTDTADESGTSGGSSPATTDESGGASSSSTTDTNFVASAADDTEDPSDDQLKEAILGALCDEWQRFNRDVRLGLDEISDRVSDVLPGSSEGLVRHNVQRLAEDGFVNFEHAYETVTLRARGVGKYEELSDEQVVPDTDIVEVLEPLYQRARHSPQNAHMGRDELLDEVYLEGDKLDRTIWYLQDVGMPLGGIVLDGAGFIDVVAQGSQPWWISAEINKFGKDLYEEFSE